MSFQFRWLYPLKKSTSTIDFFSKCGFLKCLHFVDDSLCPHWFITSWARLSSFCFGQNKWTLFEIALSTSLLQSLTKIKLREGGSSETRSLKTTFKLFQQIWHHFGTYQYHILRALYREWIVEKYNKL